MIEDQPPTDLPKVNSKKFRWTHYVFEFIMLFLAVTLGFFVENQRERMSEREYEVRLVSTLLNDVKTDIKRVDEIIPLRSDRIRKNDSLYILLYSPHRNEHISKIYEYMRGARSHRTLFYLSNTMTYLANGGFQRLSNRMVEEETRKYYLSVQDLLASQQSSLEIGQEIIEKSRHLMDANVMFALNHADTTSKKPISLASFEPEQINNYCNAVLHFNANCGVQIQFLNKIRQQGEKLVASIEKEYGL